MNDDQSNKDPYTMDRTFEGTVKLFIWKHWKCFQCAWLKNLLMIIVPIAIVWFQIHVTSSSGKGAASNFQSITEVI